MPDRQMTEVDGLDIRISRKLRAAMGEQDEPGTCQDCGGAGVVPNSAELKWASWRQCPTCKGQKVGGRA